MRKYVFCFYLFLIVTLVASNPTSQRVTSQQRPLNNFVPLQASASQPQLCNQNVKVQNQTPNLGNFDGTVLTDLLMSKILGDPSLQKILDPNTRLYKPNGQEVQRQPMGECPSIVNNYFIVPPDFITGKNNKTAAKSKNTPKRIKNNADRKTNQAKVKAKIKVPTNNEKLKTASDIELIDHSNNYNRSKKGKKKQNQVKFAKIVEEPEKKDEKEPQKGMKRTKRKRKQNNSKYNENNNIQTSRLSEYSQPHIHKEEITTPAPVSSLTKRRTKSKKKPEVIDETQTSLVTELNQELVKPKTNGNTPRNDKIKLVPAIERSSQGITLENTKLKESTDESHSKPIKSSVENWKLLDNRNSTKPAQDYRTMKNPKSDKVRKGEAKNPNPEKNTHEPRPINSPVNDDIFKNFFPYMYMGNNFYPNSNYPFDFEHFYQPYLATNKKNDSTDKTRKKQNVPSNKDSLPNIIEIKLKPKKQLKTTTTDKPLSTEIIEKVISDHINTDTSTESAEFITQMHTKLHDHKLPLNEKKEDISEELALSEFTLPKKESMIPKASLEMPPTVIEDLHEFMVPELGREDILPTAHTNGIIDDYYPIFNDDSYYANEENFFVRDLEDDRHFYTTDKGFEENLNRERRKFEKHEDNLNTNVDFMDRVNFRRVSKYRERDKNSKVEYEYVNNKDLNNDDRITQFENIVEKEEKTQENILENQFQTPPLLENPDFQTRKIERISPIFDSNNHYMQEPVYTEFAEVNPDVKFYIDKKPIQYSRLVFDSDVKKEDHVTTVATTTRNPINDRIETVYAKTRVVKYGVAKDETDETPSMSKIGDEKEQYYSDGQTTYVLAKSLGKVEDYYW